jgi:hypothetical protein
MKGPATTATVTISFDKDGGVRLDRVDTAGTPGVTATYNGKIAADSTISGSVTWYNNGVFFWNGKWSGTVTMPAPQAADPPTPEPPGFPAPTAPAPAPMPSIPPPPDPSTAQVSPAAQIAVSIDSSPPGADIEIDGAFVGNTPSTVNVAAGSHDIAVKKKGFADWTKKLSVTGGSIHLEQNHDKRALKRIFQSVDFLENQHSKALTSGIPIVILL